MHPLLSRIQEIFELHPKRMAIIDKDERQCTYGELSQLVSFSRRMLIRKNVTKGTRVLVAVPMSIELYAILLALFSLGGIAVFLDPWLKGQQMNRIIKKVRPEVLIISSRFRWLAYFIPSTRGIKYWWSVSRFKVSPSILQELPSWNKEVIDVDDNDVALVTFTGGTSGQPKGADRSFGFLAAQLKALIPHLGGTTINRDLTNFPIVGLADLALGNTVVVPNINLMKIHRASPSEITGWIEKTNTGRLIVSPSLLERVVVGLTNNQNKFGLHTVMTGGAPIPHRLVETCLQYFPGIHFEALFGSTEAEPMATTSFPVMKKNMSKPLKGVFVGKPVDNIRLKIIQPCQGPVKTAHFDQLIAKKGEVGELVVTGEHVNKRYFENPEAFNENKIIDKHNEVWHRTGDLGYHAHNGIYLVGRRSRIVARGEKVYYPYPIEFFLEQKLGLKDTGYIQSEQGEIILCIGGNPALNKNEIRKELEHSQYPVDRILLFKRNLPRDPRHRSKLDMGRLKSMLKKRKKQGIHL